MYAYYEEIVFFSNFTSLWTFYRVLDFDVEIMQVYKEWKYNNVE